MNNTLVKGLRLLEELAHADQPLGVTELGQRLSLPKSNVHRLLQGLVALGYVRALEGGRGYAATIRLWELGTAVLAQLDLKRVAQPWMEQLQARTRETVHLSVLDGSDVVYVHKIDSDEPVRAYSQIGGRAPAHCVATGKALLAGLDDEQLRLRAATLVRATTRSIQGEAALLREMSRVRAQGYAINRGEWRDTVGGVAAPVQGARRQVVAAVGISGPLSRLAPARLRALAGPVMEAARGITMGLQAGAAGPQAGWAFGAVTHTVR